MGLGLGTLGLGLTSSFLGRSSTAAYVFTNTEAENYVARMSVAPDNSRKAAIDNFFTSVKAIGLSKFDVIYLFAAHTEQAALLNAKSTSFNATNSGAAFTANAYFEPDGVSTFVDSTFNASTAGGVFVQNSAHFSFWNSLDTLPSSASPWAGANAGVTPNTQNSPIGNDSTLRYRVNDATTDTAAGQTIKIGLFGVNREAASGTDAKRAFTNGTQTDTSTTVSTGLSNNTIKFGKVNTSFVNRQYAFASIGSSLTPAEHLALYNAVAAYRSAL